MSDIEAVKVVSFTKTSVPTTDKIFTDAKRKNPHSVTIWLKFTFSLVVKYSKA